MMTIPPWLDISVISAFASIKDAVMNISITKVVFSSLVLFSHDRFFAPVTLISRVKAKMVTL